MLKRVGLIIVFVMGLGIHIPESFAKSKWLLHQRDFQLNEKVWAYFAPGTMKNSQLFPTRGHDGLLIKNYQDQKKRLNYVLRSTPLNQTAVANCEKNIQITKGKITEKSDRDCVWSLTGRDGKVTTQWIYQDIKSLKLVSFSVTTHAPRLPEVIADIQTFRQELFK